MNSTASFSILSVGIIYPILGINIFNGTTITKLVHSFVIQIINRIPLGQTPLEALGIQIQIK